jgi:hypothetical protein
MPILTPLLNASHSYVFVEFRNAEDADFARQAMDGFAFDRAHTFRVNRFTDIENYANMEETYAEPEVEEFKPRVCYLSSREVIPDVSLYV